MNAISSYVLGQDGKVEIRTPYSAAVIEQCRAWGGKYEKGRGWLVPKTRLEAVQEQIGKVQSDLVEVEIGKDDLDETGAEYRLGWHVIAARQSRDRPATLYAELVAGEVPASGGSAKHPCVKASDDARFRLWVPRDFAAARNLTVTDDPLTDATPADHDPGPNPLAAFADDAIRAEFVRRGLTV